MFEIEADKERNLLILSFTRDVVPQEAERCRDAVREALENLKTGFRLLTDLSGLESMDPECIPYIKGVMDLFNQKGIAGVVRIIPDPRKDIGFSILSLFHYRRGIPIVTCGSAAEAKAALSG